jgi:hypothetical protein
MCENLKIQMALFHLFFLILTCSCQYSYNLILTSNCMCRPYIDTNNPQGMQLGRFKNRTPARFEYPQGYEFHSIKNFRNCAVKMLHRFFANLCHEIGCENDQTYIFRFVKYLSTFFYSCLDHPPFYNFLFT